jgi:hypothetical protein
MSLHLSSPRRSRNVLTSLTRSSGQAVVEFTLVFLLFLVIAWIPADFGLAFYTAQLAQNASRDGARIAAADPKLGSGTIPGVPWGCIMPSCSGNILSETAARISSALLPGATITVELEPDSVPPRCDRNVTVTVSGNYNYFFYRLLRALGNTVPDSLNIVRSTSMRWEHQFGC